MTGVDIGLYDYDPHASIFFFIVSPDEEIYLRYGGRDAVAADSYLDLASLELALELGLEQHARWRAGELPERPRPASFYPRDIEALQKTEMRGRRSCVECHHIGDYKAAELEATGKLDKPRVMFRSPDIRPSAFTSTCRKDSRSREPVELRRRPACRPAIGSSR